MYHKMTAIRSDTGSYELNKVSLSYFDDKRFIHTCNNRITSYVYGHYKTEQKPLYCYILFSNTSEKFSLHDSFPRESPADMRSSTSCLSENVFQSFREMSRNSVDGWY